MDFWGEIAGQSEAVAALQAALQAREVTPVAHAWLFTGPPGSGRFNLALKFATALVAQACGAVDLAQLQQRVAAGSHPDVQLVRTQTNLLTVELLREVVANAYFAPAVSPQRVIVIEDADRMNEGAANSILKALEEPPPSTVWILCAPSEADLLPTIRSRTRLLRLKTPTVAEAAQVLIERDGIAADAAHAGARLAQGHIGMAKRLATDSQARARRTDTIAKVLNITNLSSAMAAAAALAQLADDDAKNLVSDTIEQEKNDLYRTLGLAQDEKVPREFARVFKELETESKRRLSRAKIDGVDRVLVDILSLCRDIVALQLADDAQLVNAEHTEQIRRVSQQISLRKATEFAAHIQTARMRLGRNMQPALALEAALVSLFTIEN